MNIEDNDLQFKFQQFSQLNTILIPSKQFNLGIAVLCFMLLLQPIWIPFATRRNFVLAKAQVIVNNAQTANEAGMESTQSGKKSFLPVENTPCNPLFKGVRDCMYDYHRNGLDKMHENVEDGFRANVLKALDLLKLVYAARPASFVMQVFFNSKRDELINIFKESPSKKRPRQKKH